MNESESAKRFTEAMELLEAQKRLDDSKVKGLGSKCRVSLAKGKTKKAMSYADGLYSLASRNPDPSPLKVSLDESQIRSGEIDIIVSNREVKPIVVRQYIPNGEPHMTIPVSVLKTQNDMP